MWKYIVIWCIPIWVVVESPYNSFTRPGVLDRERAMDDGNIYKELRFDCDNAAEFNDVATARAFYEVKLSETIYFKGDEADVKLDSFYIE